MPGNFNDGRFEQCRFWGDPHITRSWRPKSRFNFQGLVRSSFDSFCLGSAYNNVYTCQLVFTATPNSANLCAQTLAFIAMPEQISVRAISRSTCFSACQAAILSIVGGVGSGRCFVVGFYESHVWGGICCSIGLSSSQLLALDCGV